MTDAIRTELTRVNRAQTDQEGREESAAATTKASCFWLDQLRLLKLPSNKLQLWSLVSDFPDGWRLKKLQMHRLQEPESQTRRKSHAFSSVCLQKLLLLHLC